MTLQITVTPTGVEPPPLPPSDDGPRTRVAANDPWAAFPEVPPSPAAPQQAADPWAGYPEVGGGFADTLKDIGRSAATGLLKGGLSVAGIPGDLRNMVDAGLDKVLSLTGSNQTMANARKRFTEDMATTRIGRLLNMIPEAPTTSDLRGRLEALTGPLPEPQTTPGRYAETAASFIPPALIGGGNLAGNAVRFGVLPGLASEFAGQQTAGTQYEPLARFGGALAAGSLAGMTARPSTAAQSLRNQMPTHVTADVIDQAETLMRTAQAKGVNLSWAEAIEQVRPGSGLPDVQRTLEGAHQSRPVLNAFYANRPAQVSGAAAAEFDRLAAPTANPSSIGPAASETSQLILRKIEGAINRATRPLYDASRQTLVPAPIHAAMMSDPLFAAALDAIRKDPAKNAMIGMQSDRSIAVYDAIKKELAERSRNATSLLNPYHSEVVSSATGSLSGDVRDIAIAADRNAVNGPSSYQAALEQQAHLRQTYLDPLLQGPLGRIAKADMTTQRAIEALFPHNPLPNSQQEIATAMRAIVAKRPAVGELLVRAHAESTFNDAARNLQGGANPKGGANFARDIAGNAQQRANLQAAVEALPDGVARWQGFERFLEVMEATGKRPDIGSRTAFNTGDIMALAKGGNVAGAVKTALAPGSWWTLAKDKISQWQLGSNLGELARILTDPKAALLLKQLAAAPRGSGEAQAIALRVLLVSRMSANERDQAEQPRK